MGVIPGHISTIRAVDPLVDQVLLQLSLVRMEAGAHRYVVCERLIACSDVWPELSRKIGPDLFRVTCKSSYVLWPRGSFAEASSLFCTNKSSHSSESLSAITCTTRDGQKEWLDVRSLTLLTFKTNVRKSCSVGSFFDDSRRERRSRLWTPLWCRPCIRNSESDFGSELL